MGMTTEETKVCKIHGEQPLSDYYYNCKRYRCKLCVKEKSLNYLHEHKEDCSKYQKKYRLERRLKVLQFYSKSDIPFCACCGEAHIEFLVVDHIDGGGTKHRELIRSQIITWIIDHDYPPLFRVLCHNCNNAISHYDRCPHQGQATSFKSRALSMPPELVELL